MALPSGYRRLKSISSTGTQYLNTNYYPTYQTRVVAVMSNTSAKGCLFGVRDTSSTSSPRQFALYVASATSFRSDYFGTNKTATVTSTAGKIEVDKDKHVAVVNGTTITNTSKTSGVCTYPMWIFTYNNVGATGTFTNSSMEVFKIYEAGTLLHDYIPAMRISDNKPGAYDDVTGEFLTNAGTGEFTYEEVPLSGKHRTLIDGTVWGIPSGRCFVGGVGYNAQKGRTLVGGTGYDLVIGNPPIIATVSGTGNTSCAYATIGSYKYYLKDDLPASVEVKVGDVITLVAAGYYGSTIKIDGKTVASGDNDGDYHAVTYNWEVPEGISAIDIVLKYSGSGTSRNGYITVTTS